ncbi:MAG: Outer rane efflux protein [Rhodospirillales bacterium]|nr:Outer rane efflux protein [Rhodospirillales bacterium]
MELLVVQRAPARRLLASAALLALLVGCSVKPEPVPDEDRFARIATDRTALHAIAPAPAGPITPDEAIARAIKYNLDHRLAQMEMAVQGAQLDLARFDMLPRLAANAGYNIRSNENASSSVSVLTRRQSLEPSTSSDRAHGVASLTFSWNILDFGVSYYQAKQQANRSLVAEERRRRVLNALVQELRGAYWQAFAAQRLTAKLDPVLADAEKALVMAEKLEQERLRAPEEALRYQKSLLELTRQLRQLRTEAYVARARLGALMGFAPGTIFKLDPGVATLAVTPQLGKPNELETIALYWRPELREEDYQARIARAEITKAELRMLPGLSLESSYNYDTNSFLVNQNWAEAGARATWNLIGLLSGPTSIDLAEAQVNVTEARRLALTMAVITQVNIAWLQFRETAQQYAEASKLQRVEEKLYQNVSNAAAVDAESQLEKIRAATAALAAEFKRDRTYADYQSAIGGVAASVGANPVPDDVDASDLGALTKAVAATSARWSRGEFVAPGLAAIPAGAPVLAEAQAPALAPAEARRPVIAEAPAPRPARVAKAETSASRWFVQVGYFAEQRNIEKLKQALDAQGPLETTQTKLGGRDVTQLRAGPFTDAGAARTALAAARHNGAGDAALVRQ